MKKLVLKKILPGKREVLERWLKDLESVHRNEAKETMRQEGISREWGAIANLYNEDYFIGYAEGGVDIRPADLSSNLNRRHQEILKECLDDKKSTFTFGYDILV